MQFSNKVPEMSGVTSEPQKVAPYKYRQYQHHGLSSWAVLLTMITNVPFFWRALFTSSALWFIMREQLQY